MLIYREQPDVTKFPYPMLMSPKLDGIRGAGVGTALKSRTLKDLPNRRLQLLASQLGLNGFDGEVICGSPVAEDVYRVTDSGVMSHHTVNPFTYYVFDYWPTNNAPYRSRLAYSRDNVFLARERAESLGIASQFDIQLIRTDEVNSPEEVAATEQMYLDMGYEGAIARNPNGIYKFNRTTLKEMNVFKLKQFTDGEAIIIGFEEEMENTNEAEVNELGRTKRSTALAGMVGKNTLGAFIVRDCVSGREFKIGSGRGLTKELRAKFWTMRVPLLGVIVKYKSFAIGVKDKPRHPVWHGFRNPMDM